MRRFLTLGTLVVIAGLGLFWFTGGFERLAAWAADHQRAFQNTIATALRAARAGEAGAIWALLVACFAYGLAHAAGPGHGKILIGGYGMARRVPMLRLSMIALAASLGQAVTAVALVYAGVTIFDMGRTALIGVTEDIMAPVSYGAIALIGGWLVWRGGRHLRDAGAPAGHAHDHEHGHAHGSEGGQAHGHGHGHEADGVCASCGHAHGPTLAQVENTHTLRDALTLIAGIALRPCTGALFVLIITWQMGIGGLGIGGAFAMALGTGCVTIAVGLAAGGLRGGLLAGIAGGAGFARVAALVEVLAGVTVVLLAGGLLLRAIA